MSTGRGNPSIGNRLTIFKNNDVLISIPQKLQYNMDNTYPNTLISILGSNVTDGPYKLIAEILKGAGDEPQTTY